MGLVRGMVRRRVAQDAVVVLVVKGKAEEVLVAKGKAENREEPRMVEEQLRLLLLLEVRLLVVARQQGIGWGRRRKRLEGTMVRDKTSTQPARCMSLV